MLTNPNMFPRKTCRRIHVWGTVCLAWILFAGACGFVRPQRVSLVDPNELPPAVVSCYEEPAAAGSIPSSLQNPAETASSYIPNNRFQQGEDCIPLPDADFTLNENCTVDADIYNRSNDDYPDWSRYASLSEVLGVSLSGTENLELLNTVKNWLGTRYRYGGCSPRSGIDCSCFVKIIYKRVYGIQLKRSSAGMYRYDTIPIRNEPFREGDLLFFTNRHNRINHVGVYLADHKFAHSVSSGGVQVDDLRNPYYRKRFFAAGRAPAVTAAAFASPAISSR